MRGEYRPPPPSPAPMTPLRALLLVVLLTALPSCDALDPGLGDGLDDREETTASAGADARASGSAEDRLRAAARQIEALSPRLQTVASWAQARGIQLPSKLARFVGTPLKTIVKELCNAKVAYAPDGRVSAASTSDINVCTQILLEYVPGLREGIERVERNISRPSTPDLEPITLRYSYAGSSRAVTLDFDVYNRGDAASRPTTVQFRLRSSSGNPTATDPYLGEVRLPAVEARRSRPVSVTLRIPSPVASGSHHLWVIVDPDGRTSGQASADRINDRARVGVRL